MQAVITTILSLIAKLAPGATTELITQIITVLTELIPVLVETYKDLLPVVQNIITALKSNAEITDDQWAALDALSAQYDAAFQAALSAAEADDAAAAGTSPAS
jgi:hypothetical protein